MLQECCRLTRIYTYLWIVNYRIFILKYIINNRKIKKKIHQKKDKEKKEGRKEENVLFNDTLNTYGRGPLR